MKSKRSLRVALALLAPPLLALASPPSYAGSQDVIDGGTFTLFLNNARIGEEQFFIRQDRTGTARPM